MKGLTQRTDQAQNCDTTTLNGNTAPRKSCGFFVSGFCHQGPLTPLTGTGTRQFSEFGAWSIGRDKPGNRANNANRFRAVVESMRHPFRGDASSILIGATAMSNDNTQNPSPKNPLSLSERLNTISDANYRVEGLLMQAQAVVRLIDGVIGEKPLLKAEEDPCHSAILGVQTILGAVQDTHFESSHSLTQIMWELESLENADNSEASLKGDAA